MPPSLSAIIADLPELSEQETPPTPVTPRRRASPPPGRREKGLLSAYNDDPLKFLAEAAEAATAFSSSSGRVSRVKRRPLSTESAEDSEWEVDAADYDYLDEEEPPPKRKVGRPRKTDKVVPKKSAKESKQEKTKVAGTPSKAAKAKTAGSGRGRPPVSADGSRRKSSITTTVTCHAATPPRPQAGAHARGSPGRVPAHAQAASDAQRLLKTKLMSDEFRSARTEGCRSVVKAEVDLRNSPSCMLGKIPPRSKIKHLKNRLLRTAAAAPTSEVTSDDGSDVEQFPLMSSGFDHNYARRTQQYSKISMMPISHKDWTGYFEHNYSLPPYARCPSTSGHAAQKHFGHQQLTSDPLMFSASLSPHLRIVPSPSGLAVLDESSGIETSICPADVTSSQSCRYILNMSPVTAAEGIAVPLTTTNLLTNTNTATTATTATSASSTSAVPSSQAPPASSAAKFSHVMNQVLRASSSVAPVDPASGLPASVLTGSASVPVAAAGPAAPSTSAGVGSSSQTAIAGGMTLPRPSLLGATSQYPFAAAIAAAAAAGSSNHRLALGGQSLPLSMLPAAMSGYSLGSVGRLPFGNMLFDAQMLPLSLAHGGLLSSMPGAPAPSSASLASVTGLPGHLPASVTSQPTASTPAAPAQLRPQPAPVAPLLPNAAANQVSSSLDGNAPVAGASNPSLPTVPPNFPSS